MRPLKRLADALRLGCRLCVFTIFLLFSMATLVMLRLMELCTRRKHDRKPLMQRYLAGLCWLLGMRIAIHGSPADSAALRVCNHVSWTDIPILASCLPVRFLAKQEVASWPLIGWTARHVDTLFVRRGGGDIARVRQALAQALEGGDSVLVFPEGTTTIGESVRPFHPRLLGAAIAAGRPLQAITLAYYRDGHIDRVVPFVGDDDFVSHLCRLLREPAVQAEVLFHPPIPTSPDDCPSQLARTLHQQVSEGLELLHTTGCRNPPSPHDSSRQCLLSGINERRTHHAFCHHTEGRQDHREGQPAQQ